VIWILSGIVVFIVVLLGLAIVRDEEWSLVLAVPVIWVATTLAVLWTLGVV
jgi:hypothetical protein